MDTPIQTNLGPMTAGQIDEELRYSSYRAQRRLYNVSVETLARFYGDEPVRVWEERYQLECRAKAMADAKKNHDEFWDAQRYYEKWCKDNLKRDG